jgi:hypothetical protein
MKKYANHLSKTFTSAPSKKDLGSLAKLPAKADGLVDMSKDFKNG